MKKIISLLLLLSTAFSLFSCGKKYKPVKSTKEEATTVITFKADGEKYEVKYELYRTFFLTYKKQVDGGDSSVWSGPNAKDYINKINKIIIDEVATIYATLHFATTLGIDPYSNAFEDEIYEYIRIAVEGNGSDIKGHGDYDAYLASLKKLNMNYAVSTLLIRYNLTLAAIDRYYRGDPNSILGPISTYKISDEQLKKFYYSDECARVLHIYFAKGIKSEDQLKEVQETIKSTEEDIDVALYIINNSTGLESDMIVDGKVSGIMIPKYGLSEVDYANYVNSAMSLPVGETSELIEVGGTDAGYYVIRKLEKTDEHLALQRESIERAYIDNLVGKKIEHYKSALKGSVSFTEKYYKNVDHKSISMK